MARAIVYKNGLEIWFLKKQEAHYIKIYYYFLACRLKFYIPKYFSFRNFVTHLLLPHSTQRIWEVIIPAWRLFWRQLDNRIMIFDKAKALNEIILFLLSIYYMLSKKDCVSSIFFTTPPLFYPYWSVTKIIQPNIGWWQGSCTGFFSLCFYCASESFPFGFQEVSPVLHKHSATSTRKSNKDFWFFAICFALYDSAEFDVDVGRRIFTWDRSNIFIISFFERRLNMLFARNFL